MKNILFCGFGKLGTDCIKSLRDKGYNIVYILTHKEYSEDSVDSFAIENNIEYSYKDTRKDITYYQHLVNEKQIDFLVSVNYRYIIAKDIFSIPNYSINIHGSLLPKYRGRTPHVWSIINGEEYSGVTCHLIDEGVDTGNIIEQKRVKIEPDDTGYSLLVKYQLLYPDILLSSLRKLEDNEPSVIQNESMASYYGKRTPDMGYIDFYKPANKIINFVRAQTYPYPGAYYFLTNGKKIIINKITPVVAENIVIQSIGVIVEIGNNLYVKCTDSILKLINYEVID